MARPALCCTLLFFLLAFRCPTEGTSLQSNAQASCLRAQEPAVESALGDPGMTDSRVRVALEAWNFCNKVGSEGRGLPSPRQADCADLLCNSSTGPCDVHHYVTTVDNSLKSGDAFPQGSFTDFSNPDEYAVEKELYLGSLCEVPSESGAWNFWMIMLKNGNFDVSSGLCPSTAPPSKPTRPFKSRRNAKGTFPCFGDGCMNQPLIFHNWSKPQPLCSPGSQSGYGHDCDSSALTGRFYGSYDLDSVTLDGAIGPNKSYFSVMWEKHPTSGSWIFYHTLKVNRLYPWLMLYLRTDATNGESGGYPYETRGMMTKVPESPDFKVKLTLNVTKGGGASSQFYLIDIGGCWKNDGKPCDGNTSSDVTRYSEMIINPATENWCRASDISQCPPYHVDSITGKRIYRNDTANFPYGAYHLYCVPANAKFAEAPFRVCDPYSNPQPQELVQLLPHPQWGAYGFPSSKGQGWVGHPSTWLLDVGTLSHRLYFYQDPGTLLATRKWPSIDVGTEIYISEQDEMAEWTVSDFDVILLKNVTKE